MIGDPQKGNYINARFRITIVFNWFESEFKIRYFDEWSLISNWTPESRYHVTGLVSEAKAKNMFSFTSIILQSL